MSSIRPGLIVLHGNRLELLCDAVLDWLDRDPPDPLDEEIFLVQSNGAAEWLKMAIAARSGICAATRVELPGRFLWRTYRDVLGRDHVAPQSALDRTALTWRLMRLLPGQVERPSFEPIAAFLSGGDLDRRLQLARHLADLYDQYQVYRADWLAAWERGRPLLTGSGRPDRPLAADQRWQAELWRAILAELTSDERRSTRPHVHRAFLDALAADASPATPLPRRVVLFGASHIAMQGLEALAALAGRMQVVLAVPNPCRFHWADSIDGREALHSLRRRQPNAGSVDLASIPLDAMHLHAHPLLAAWGRQGRDFMRQLDAFDDAAHVQQRFALPRIDLFDDGPGTTLLQQVQANIRDLVPLSEHPGRAVGADDRSIVFHVAHGAQREVEILHDRLLAALASDHGLRPRDIVVMVPDIETFAPAIRAVFGQYRRDDSRFIPFDIADLRSRGSNPLVVALEWLLRLPTQRVRLQEVRDLLDVPAIVARFGLDAADLPRLFEWLVGAGVRWGLQADHRAQLGLAAAGTQNSWRFGLDRMLLGYAVGDAPSFAGIEPYDEIGGLEAATVGSLADLFSRLDAWWSVARAEETPSEWAARCRTLLATFFAPVDEREKLTVAALQAALAAWLDACATAGFDEKLPLSVLREAWLSGVDGLDASRRFLTGGVTFCTLMPLRAVPFEVVCLLGMNDGDFPRQGRRDDFDLMAIAGQQRPGDRSRRDDDRYLMLEALLSARRTLYVGWTGRSANDNSEQPPSVLVSQLRDYLRAGWRRVDDGRDGGDVLADRTTAHPLQPFSRRYFEAGGPTTFAVEWRAAHASRRVPAATSAWALPAIDATPLTVVQLVRFLKNPVREFFRVRLDVRVRDEHEALDENEPFEVAGLERYQLRTGLLADPARLVAGGADDGVAARVRRLRASGRLPMFELGARDAAALAATTGPMLGGWSDAQRAFPNALPKVALRVDGPHAGIDDWLDGLRGDGTRVARIVMTASRVVGDRGQVAADKLLDAWVWMLVARVCGHAVDTVVIAPDATVTLQPLESGPARAALDDLLRAWHDGMRAPSPFAAKTAFASLVDRRSAVATYEGNRQTRFADRRDFALARVYPDHAALVADGRFATRVDELFAPVATWIASNATIVVHEAAMASAMTETGEDDA